MGIRTGAGVGDETVGRGVTGNVGDGVAMATTGAGVVTGGRTGLEVITVITGEGVLVVIATGDGVTIITGAEVNGLSSGGIVAFRRDKLDAKDLASAIKL